jgi:hypothetical protein
MKERERDEREREMKERKRESERPTSCLISGMLLVDNNFLNAYVPSKFIC